MTSIKWISLTVLLSLLWISGAAQDLEGTADSPLGGKVKAARVAYITQRMSLTPQESEKFWALNNEYGFDSRCK